MQSGQNWPGKSRLVWEVKVFYGWKSSGFDLRWADCQARASLDRGGVGLVVSFIGVRGGWYSMIDCFSNGVGHSRSAGEDCLCIELPTAKLGNHRKVCIKAGRFILHNIYALARSFSGVAIRVPTGNPALAWVAIPSFGNAGPEEKTEQWSHSWTDVKANALCWLSWKLLRSLP